MQFQNTLDFAKELDKKDSISHIRDKFHIPKNSVGEETIYFCGNSLGLQPKSTQEAIQIELTDWANLGVEGHFKAENPWLNYHSYLTKPMARIVGAKPIEVVVMNTLTTNLHLMLASFYQPNKEKSKIIIEKDAFPSDRFAVESQIKHHNLSVDENLIIWEPNTKTELYETSELERLLVENKNQIALILVGGVNYYTGQYLPLKKIAKIGHEHNCYVGFDCAHGAGNVKLNLHESNADFAVWCTYKYLNSGPGSLGGAFVHEKHAYNKNLKRLSGWWNHNIKTRFNMRDEFDVIPGAEGWQLSNPPILSMAAIKSSLEIFNETSIEELTSKSKLLTGYFQYLLNEIKSPLIKIITPNSNSDRGCQLSVKLIGLDKSFHKKISEKNIVTDWREPNVIRCAPVPLYNTFEEVYLFVKTLKTLLKNE
jgi:kynureninase